MAMLAFPVCMQCGWSFVWLYLHSPCVCNVGGASCGYACIHETILPPCVCNVGGASCGYACIPPCVCNVGGVSCGYACIHETILPLSPPPPSCVCNVGGASCGFCIHREVSSIPTQSSAEVLLKDLLATKRSSAQLRVGIEETAMNSTSQPRESLYVCLHSCDDCSLSAPQSVYAWKTTSPFRRS